MKTHHIFHRWILVALLLLGAFVVSQVSAQNINRQRQETPKAEEPEEPVPSAPAAESAQKATTTDTAPAPTTSSESDSDIWAYIKKIDPQKLWKENGIIAWACLLGYIFAGMVLGKIVSVLIVRYAADKEGAVSKTISDMAGPANLSLITLGIYGGLQWLTLSSKTLEELSTKSIKLLFTIAIYWYLNNLIGLVDPLLHRLGRNSASALDKHVAPLVRRSLRVFLIILTVMYVLKDVFDKDIGAWLAGLGIAGIAVSLAAQDSLKNLFGSITIILDRPFKIGDRIICTGYEGVIEDIGFRSTKVRTSAGYLVSIPNANVVNSPIENISRRPGIRRNFTINLAADTPAEKVKEAVQIVRGLLEDPELREPILHRINGDAAAPQVACGDFINNNLQLTITYWFASAKSSEFAQHSEKLNLRILQAFEQAGVRLAAPK